MYIGDGLVVGFVKLNAPYDILYKAPFLFSDDRRPPMLGILT